MEQLYSMHYLLFYFKFKPNRPLKPRDSSSRDIRIGSHDKWESGTCLDTKSEVLQGKVEFIRLPGGKAGTVVPL